MNGRWHRSGETVRAPQVGIQSAYPALSGASRTATGASLLAAHPSRTQYQQGIRDGVSKAYETALEVVSYDRTTGESTVLSAFGLRADWYQNIMAHAALEVQTARRRYVPKLRLLDAEERFAALATYERR